VVAQHDPRVAQWNAWSQIEDDVSPQSDPTDCVAFLQDLAGDGPALDLGPGGGRIAVPLAAAGTQVTALDLSPEIATSLRQRAGVLPLEVVVGDMAAFSLPAPFEVVYSTWSTFFALLTQEQQASCFASAAQSLTASGAFVVDVFSPLNDQGVRGRDGWAIRTLTSEFADLVLTRHDAVNQRLRLQEVRLSGDGNRLVPIDIRYAWPTEMDLMARLAGLQLAARYGGWRREPFTAYSFRNVAVYRRQLHPAPIGPAGLDSTG
jgi:hypothetical protein